ncbi:hypothetical protein LL06_15070 [Hoeflea sp. BAL378]|uniref:hypothetical protein n=1 Tax=Hoeflea sp. BAL378 TaxID=1547437 RepID=UPI000513F566|nr:hypothetical protein [Hoeflea sp. BAL378]KGF68694.1 hypothetical protein LL06_15070 [Hoeflea sp. BAL378]
MTAYGPFHRVRSPTQSYEVALQQKDSGEIWGRPHGIGGRFPKVKAYILPLCAGEPAGTLCADEQGIEFSTRVRPTVKTPSGVVYWDNARGPIDGIRVVDDETIALEVTIYKLVYEEHTGAGQRE